MRLVIVSAGHAPTSGTSRLGRLIAETAGTRSPDLEWTQVELREIAVDVVTALVTGEPSRAVLEAIEVVRGAGLLVLLTPTINASFSGLLKAFLDVLPRDALRGMPTLMGATGGTHRHTLVLDQSVRPMLAFLRAVVVPSCLFVTADEWVASRPGEELRRRVESVTDELFRFAAFDARI